MIITKCASATASLWVVESSVTTSNRDCFVTHTLCDKSRSDQSCMAPRQISSKKRPAPSQTGPKAKKAHIEKPLKTTEKRRSRPITAPVKSTSDSEADEEDWEDEGGEGGDNDEANENAVIEDDPGEIEPAAPIIPKDPNGLSSPCRIHYL